MQTSFLMERWVPGQQIVVEEVWNGRLWSLRPVLVVDDCDEMLVLWAPKGSVRHVPTVPSSRPRADTRAERLMSCLANEDWVLADSEWDVSTLWLTEWGSHHSVWISFLDDGSHWGWYINLQRPLERTPRGVKTMDLMLDVIVEPVECPRFRGHLSAWSALSGWAGRMACYAEGIELQEAVCVGVPA